MKIDNFQSIIGLEVHVELKTKSKMFCGCSADHFGKEPNTQVCPVCLGLPGTLPIPNKKALEWCVLIGLAFNCQIPFFSKFDRKNYFYPDLPKGYQISQYDKPFAINGFVILGSKATPESDSGQARMTNKRICIRRVHMEEDTAKLVHQQNYSLIDFNRSGVPLVEVVTEPDFENAEEVITYLKRLQQLVRYLGVSDADMEKGEMRLEPNISVREIRNKELPKYKVEIKNINSFRFVERAINYEIERQRQLLEKGETPKQETRGWSEEKNTTLPQRGKEEVHDYRYFAEPDIPPIRWQEKQLLELRGQLPELPDAKSERFKKRYRLPDYNTEILTRERETADYFEKAVADCRSHKVTPKQIANYMINKKVDMSQILPAQLVQMILSASQVVTIDEEKIEKIIKKVLLDNPKAVSDYKKGKDQAIMFLVGQVMREFKEKIDAKVVREKIEESMQKI